MVDAGAVPLLVLAFQEQTQSEGFGPVKVAPSAHVQEPDLSLKRISASETWLKRSQGG